jgi:hypothetical protein
MLQRSQLPSRAAGSHGSRKRKVGLVAMCRGCGYQFEHLGRHHAKNAECDAAHNLCGNVDTEDDLEAGFSIREMEINLKKKKSVFGDVAEWYFFRYLGGLLVSAIQLAVQRWVKEAVADMHVDLLHIIEEKDTAESRTAKVEKLLHSRLNFFDGLETEDAVKRYAEKHLSVPEVHSYSFGDDPKDRRTTASIAHFLLTVLRTMPEGRAHIVERSELYKSGARQQPPNVLEHIDQGYAFSRHDFAKPVQDVPGEPTEVRAILVFGSDELELTGPLKQSRGVHKQAMWYVSIANLPEKLRWLHMYMMMLMAVGEKTLDKFNPVRVFAGADPTTGELIDEDYWSPGAQLRRGWDGFVTTVGATPPASLLLTPRPARARPARAGSPMSP